MVGKCSVAAHGGGVDARSRASTSITTHTSAVLAHRPSTSGRPVAMWGGVKGVPNQPSKAGVETQGLDGLGVGTRSPREVRWSQSEMMKIGMDWHDLSECPCHYPTYVVMKKLLL